MNYFIDKSLIIKNTKIGLGIFSIKNILSNTIIEHSPFSNCWNSTWQDTPENLRKIVFSFPQNTDNYVLGLGYTAIYNHSDNNNAIWLTSENGIYIKTIKDINSDEEIFIHYGEGYWSGGWTKY